jgi:hypothetical protein
MKKKISIGLVVVIVLIFGAYNYIYQDHRNISSEEANYSVSVASLINELHVNDSLTLKKYRDKTIELSGKITTIDESTNSIVVDEKMNAVLTDSIPKYIKINQCIKIKGRFIDYDDLLEEFKMDQVSILK